MFWLVFEDKQGDVVGVQLNSDRMTAVVGRHKTCEVRTGNDTVSRRHANVSLTSSGVLIQDRGSSNGVFFEQNRVEEMLVPAGGIFRCGEFEVGVFAELPKGVIPVVFQRDPVSSKPTVQGRAVAPPVPPPPALVDQDIPEAKQETVAEVPSAIEFGVPPKEGANGEVSELSSDAAIVIQEEGTLDSELDEGLIVIDEQPQSDEPPKQELVELEAVLASTVEEKERALASLQEASLAAQESQEALRQAESETNTLKDENGRLSALIETHEVSLGEATARVEELEGEIARVSAEQEASGKSAEELEEIRAALQTARGEAEGRAKELEELGDEQSGIIKELEGTLKSLPSTEEWEQLQARAAELEGAATELEEASGALSGLEEANAKLQTQVTTLEEERSAQTAGREAAQGELKKLTKKLAGLESALEDRPDASDLKKANKAKEKEAARVEKLEAELKDLRHRAELAEGKHQAEVIRVEELEEHQKALTDDLRAKEAELSSRPSVEDHARAEVERDKAKTEYEDLKAMFTDAASREELEEAQKEARRLLEENERLTDDLNGVRLDLKKSENEMGKQTKELKKRTEELAGLNEELITVQDAIKKSESANESLQKSVADHEKANLDFDAIQSERDQAWEELKDMKDENEILSRSNRQHVKRIADLMERLEDAQSAPAPAPDSSNDDELNRLQDDLKEAREAVEGLRLSEKEASKTIASLEKERSQFKSDLKKAATTLEKTQSEVASLREAKGSVDSVEGSADLGWVTEFYDDVNDSISQWRNDARSAEGLANDLKEENYVTENERSELIVDLCTANERIRELSETMKKVVRGYRDHLEEN